MRGLAKAPIFAALILVMLPAFISLAWEQSRQQWMAQALATPAQNNTELGPKDGKELPPADLDRVKVGSEAPNFSLEDQNGQVVTLSDFRGKKGAILVFYRGKW